MVPSGAFGLPRTEDSGSVRAERWEDANRSKSDPVPRVRKEKTLQYIEVEPGTRLQGLEVCGDVRPVEVEADCNFEMSPLAASLCIPLQLRVAELGHPDHVPTVESSLNRMIVLRLMTEPGIGLPMTWQSLAAGTLPSVIVTRADGVPVTPAEWRVIGEYLKYADEELDEEETRRPSVFRDFVCGLLHGTEEMEDPILHPPGGAPLFFLDIVPALSTRLPLGSTVRPRGLEGRAELNGRSGNVVRYDEGKLRVGVEFPHPTGVVSIRASNLEIKPAERGRRLLAEHEKNRRAEYGGRR